jgi:hypothetical protein
VKSGWLSKTNKYCTSGKRSYSTATMANRTLEKLLKNREKQGNKIVSVLDVYECSCCGKWHYGKTGKIDWSKVV